MKCFTPRLKAGVIVLQDTYIFVEVDVDLFPIIILEATSHCKIENSNKGRLEILAIEVCVKICELDMKSIDCLLDESRVRIAGDLRVVWIAQ